MSQIKICSLLLPAPCVYKESKSEEVVNQTGAAAGEFPHNSSLQIKCFSPTTFHVKDGVSTATCEYGVWKPREPRCEPGKTLFVIVFLHCACLLVSLLHLLCMHFPVGKTDKDTGFHRKRYILFIILAKWNDDLIMNEPVSLKVLKQCRVSHVTML